jgi:hypothetical protein
VALAEVLFLVVVGMELWHLHQMQLVLMAELMVAVVLVDIEAQPVHLPAVLARLA